MIILPTYEVLAVPDVTLYVKEDEFRAAALKEAVTDEQVLLVMTRENRPRMELTAEDLYPVAILGEIQSVSPDGYVSIHTSERVHLNNVEVDEDGFFDISYSILADIEDLSEEDEQRHLREIKEALTDFSKDFEWGEAARSYVRRYRNIGEAATALSSWLDADAEERYQVLATDSRSLRMLQMERIIYRFIELGKVRAQAAQAQAEEQKQVYREQALRKQIEILQSELDKMHPEELDDLRNLELKLEELPLNDTARAEATKVLRRLKKENQHSSEYGLLTDYLEYLSSMPWERAEAHPIDVARAEEILDEDHYGLKKVKSRVIQQIAVMNLNQKQTGSILLLVGAPGTGKTSIGQSIARALDRKYVRVSLGGVKDEADIRGHRRTYIGAMAGRIIDGIHKAGVSNPVMVLDEVDKLSQSYNGDPASALLEVLDPEQNATFTDHYMNVPYDLSDVLFVCTANTTDSIPAPLLNRMEVIRFDGYTATDKLAIAKKHLVPKAAEKSGINSDQLEISDELLRVIIDDYTMEGGVRGLKKRIDTLCRVAAVELAKKPGEKVTIAPEDLREYLDMHPIRHGKALEALKPGIVTGLAWTQAGGDILFIETLATQGTGKILITGRLGDVMKESVHIAISLVKSMYPEQAEFFTTHDLHIHAPEGAVPKDGPSAGVTLTTALTSLVTGKSVDSHLAMTGEVSLRGAVTAIGGLPEKLLAAVRAGINTVYIPQDNERDLDEVAEEVRQALTIVPVSNVYDLLEKVGLAEEPVTELAV